MGSLRVFEVVELVLQLLGVLLLLHEGEYSTHTLPESEKSDAIARPHQRVEDILQRLASPLYARTHGATVVEEKDQVLPRGLEPIEQVGEGRRLRQFAETKEFAKRGQAIVS